MSARPFVALIGVLTLGTACFLAGRFSVGAPAAAAAKTSALPRAARPGATALRAAAPANAATPSAPEMSWAELTAQPATAARNAALAARLEALARTDPQRALALAQAEGNRLLREQLVLACLRGW